MTANDKRVAKVRDCDTCGHESLRPVWEGVHCGNMVSLGRGIERCPGLYVAEATQERNP